MKKINKLLAVILAAATVIPATACAKKGVEIDENEDVESITYFRNDIEAFNTARKANTPVYRALKEAMGGVDIEVFTSGASWETVLSKMWFDQELPDMFLSNGPDSPDTYKKFIDNGDIIAIDDYVNESTKDEFPHLYEKMKETAYLAQNLYYAQGKQWAVPCGWELEKSLYVRQDWIDNLNAKLAKCLVGEGVISSESQYDASSMYEQYKYRVPDTLLEFYRLARAFTLYDPDNNQKNDTYGYESEMNTDMDAWIYVAYGAGWRTEMKGADGKYINSEVSDESMYATSFLNRLLAEGYMNPNSLTNDNGTKQNDFSTGVSGMIFAHNWLNTFVGYMMDTYHLSIEEATAKITMCDPPKGRDGKYGADGGYDDFWRFTCINANRSKKRIKTCLKLLDFMYSPEGLELFEYGVKDVEFKEETDSATGETKRVSLMGTNASGFLNSLGAYDSGYQLYSLSWWTGHYYNETATNGDIISERQKRSAQYAYKVDYPYIQTQNYVSKIKGLHDYFDETSVNMMNDERERYWAAELADNPQTYNYKTFGWNDLYTVPRAFANAWRSFVKEYNGNRGGSEVYAEYNDFISSGKAMKKSV